MYKWLKKTVFLPDAASPSTTCVKIHHIRTSHIRKVPGIKRTARSIDRERSRERERERERERINIEIATHRIDWQAAPKLQWGVVCKKTHLFFKSPMCVPSLSW
jgi:hypothetical protein